VRGTGYGIAFFWGGGGKMLTDAEIVELWMASTDRTSQVSMVDYKVFARSVYDRACEDCAVSFDSDGVVITDFSFDGILKFARTKCRELKHELAAGD